MDEPTLDGPGLRPPGRIALVGAGSFGRFCIAAYRAAGDLDVLAVADPDEAALALLEAPEVRRERRWQEVIADDRVEVVHVATPPFLRQDVMLAAFAAGKSVFCEKPLALNLMQADVLVEAADRAGVGLGIDYVMRHHPAYRLLERVAASTFAGRLRSVSFQNFAQKVPAGHWFWDRARSGGILVEHGVHFFDAYGRIAGPAAAVRASSPRPEAIEATVRYAGGALGRYYHEFAFARQIELAVGIAAFEHAMVRIAGWIPTEVEIALLAPPDLLEAVAHPLYGEVTVGEGGEARAHIRFAGRDQAYAGAIVAGMRDVILRHRDADHALNVSALDARDSLALALAGQEAADADAGSEVVIAYPMLGR